MQPCSSSVVSTASASVLESGISTAIRTHASTLFVRGWEPLLGDRVPTGVPICSRGSPLPPEQGRCALHQAHGRVTHRAGPWAAVSGSPMRLQGGVAKRRRALSAICGSRSEPRRHPELQPRAGTYTWHWAQQLRWSPDARRSPPLRYTSTAISANCPEPKFLFYASY